MSKRLSSAEAHDPSAAVAPAKLAAAEAELPRSKRAKMATPMEIDEDLHSRQLAVYGRESMARMSQSSVLVIGAGGPRSRDRCVPCATL